MASIRSLRQLAQAYGTSGRRTRTPIEQQFSNIPRAITRAPTITGPAGPVPTRRAPGVSGIGGSTMRRPVDPSGLGGPTAGDVQPSDPSVVGSAIGNEMAGNIVGRGIKGGGLLGLSGLLANAPTSAVLRAIPSAFSMSAFAPLAIGSDIGGGLLASSLGESSAQEAQDQGYNLTPADIQAVQAAGARGAMSRGGIIGMGLKGLFSSRSPAQVSDEEASQMAATSHIENMQNLGPLGSYGGTAFGSLAPDSGLVGPQDSNEAITEAFQVTPQMIARSNQPGQLGQHDVGVGNAPATANTPGAVEQGGFFKSGHSAPQGGFGTTGGNFGGADSGAGSSGVSGSGGIGYGGGDSGDVGGGGGAGVGTVLCTELYRQGIMPESIYRADEKFGSNLPDDVQEGYRMWAVPLAKLMSKSRIVTGIMKRPVMAWANHMAGDKNWFGSACLTIGIPMCKAIRKLKGRELQNPNPQVHQAGLS